MPVAPTSIRVLALILALGAACAVDAEEPAKAAGPFKELKYRSIGPAAGGRVCRVAGVPGDPLTCYAATASGGVWKSTDGGNRWKPIFDDQSTSSAGSIAIAPTDANVIYVGTGEANIRGNVLAGAGVYKSTDAGKSWKNVWSQRGQIGAIVVHPRDADVVFAAVLGRAFGPNQERGIYRSTDGGANWKQVLKRDEETGASDVCMDPNNPRILFAGLWQTRRRPWGLTSGGPGSGMYVSRDGGDSWKQLTAEGLPPGPWGKVGVAVAPSDSRRVYAIIEAEKGGLFRSNDGGETWTAASTDRAIRQRAWYYSTLTIDPTNADVLWAPQVPLLKSVDGGKNFFRVSGPHHGDHHDVWIDPKNPRRIINGNDGGVDLSYDGGETWFAPPLPISQFYHINVDSRIPYHVSGTMQDIGSTAGPSDSLGSGGINPGDWYEVGGGEAGYTASDPTDPNIIYAGEYDGILTRYDHRTGLSRHVGVYPIDSSGHGAEDKKYRFRWPAPSMISLHDPKALYHGGNVLFRSLDGGQNWTALSPDLTRNDKSRQKWSGGPITGDNTGAEHYCTLSAIAESPIKKGVLWAGSDDGLVHVSKDDGKTWTNVTANIEGFPEWGTVQHIEASRSGAGAAYVVVDAHLLDDPRPYLWKTADFGATWKNLAGGGLPADSPLHVVREDAKAPHLLFAGVDRGVLISRDGGALWQPLQLNLPTVPVHDLRVTERDLVVGTLGRSIWILDDLTPIRETTPATADAPCHLFSTSLVVRWGVRNTHSRPGVGENPNRGAVVNYQLKQSAKGGVKIEILDKAGALFAELEEKEEKPKSDDPDEDDEPKKKPLSDKAGLHRVFWDLHGVAPVRIPKAKVDAGDLHVGPQALPGEYTVRMTAAGQTRTTPLVVAADPRSRIPLADLVKQNAMVKAVRDDLSRLSRAVLRIRSMRKQLAARNEALKEQPAAQPLVRNSLQAMEKLDALEGRLHNPKAKVAYDILAFKGGAKLYSQLASLYSFVMDGEGVPTQGMTEVYAGYLTELKGCLADLDAYIAGDLASLNKLAKEKDFPTIFIPPATTPAVEKK